MSEVFVNDMGVAEERGLTAGQGPALCEHGVDEAQITAMLVHNPARYFTGGQE